MRSFVLTGALPSFQVALMSAGDVRWNAAQTLERLGGDEGLFHEIIEIFLREAPKQMGNMHAALARGDKELTERIAHTHLTVDT